MKLKNIFLILCMASLFPLLLFAQERIDHLDKPQKEGSFPKLWRTWPFQRDNASKVYSVVSDEKDKIIRAEDKDGLSIQIFSNFYWPIEKYPYLNWRWRAKALPSGANESDDAKNDSACGIYIVIGKYDGHAIKYVWSSSLPKDSVVTRRDGNLKIKVVDSSGTTPSKWVKHSVNALEDYKSLFGKDLKKNPSGIGLLTDSNATQSPAACDYADFFISDKPMN